MSFEVFIKRARGAARSFGKAASQHKCGAAAQELKRYEMLTRRAAETYREDEAAGRADPQSTWNSGHETWAKTQIKRLFAATPRMRKRVTRCNPRLQR